MKTKFSRALCATTALATSLLLADAAFAQSTAGQVQELIVTGTRTAPSTGGLATQVNAPKDAAIVGQAFITTQVPSANVAQLVNLVPGVSYATEDPAGFTSGDLRIHGFDGNHVAVVLDGAPLNDTGNYAVFPGEYILGELVDHTTLNIGSADVDSPSASALGATINITSKTPPAERAGVLKLSGGSYGYGRAYGEYDTGAIGPWGTTSYFAGEYGTEKNYKGRPGTNERWSLNGRIYQPLRGSDFISLAGSYTQERLYPAFRATQAMLDAGGKYFFGDNYTWAPETATPGKADLVPTNVGPAGNDTNFYRLFPNPVNFLSLRGQSQFTLLPNLIFTFDPTYSEVFANGGGGGAAASVAENDKRLIGNASVAGVDLNGDGDTLDTVVAYGPSNTTTHRTGLTTSLLYDFNEHQHLQLAYTLDYGRHRQTGEYTTVNPLTGEPADIFGGREDNGAPIRTADGSILRTRDRFSIAMLNQFSLNYIGQFLDDRLHVNIGVRAPYFERKLNQYCYTFNGTNAYCSTIDPAKVQTAFNADIAAAAANPALTTATNLNNLLKPFSNITIGANRLPNFRFPFKADFNYDKVLPNVGVSYRLGEVNLFYASYARGLAAPKTDNLYTSSPDLVQPETSDNFAVGYRYQTRYLNLSLNLYDTEYKNRIVSSPSPDDPTLTIDRNVGDASIRGVDIEAGWNPADNFHLYGSANFNHSELKSNQTLVSSGTVFILPVKGKELVLTPEEMLSARATYDIGPLSLGMQGKYVGRRFISDLNDAAIGAYATFDADARLQLPYLNQQTYLQLNLSNIFDKYYFSRSSTFSNGVAFPIPGTTKVFTPSTPSYFVGAPRTFTITLGAKF